MREPSRQSPHTVTFTHDWYRDFVDRLVSLGYSFRSFDGPPEPGDVLLRHDIDLSVEAALEMARIEADLGVESSYFFLLTSRLYNPFEVETRERIREIEALGHDVGLHFDTHQYWSRDDPPDDAALAARIEDEQAVLESIASAPRSTVSFHIPPDWVLDRAIDGVRSTYESSWFSEPDYVSDSGQRWRETPPFPEDPPDRMQVLVHPGLWDDEDAPFDARVEAVIGTACRRTAAQARREFLEEANGR